MIRNAGFILFMLLPLLVHGQESIPVETRSPEQVFVTREIRAPADVQALNRAILAAEVSAVISTIHVDVGQVVQKGDALVDLDETDYRFALRRAEANLESSQAQKIQADLRLQRGRDLGEKQFLSAEDLLTRETDLRIAAAQILVQEVNVASARRQLEKCQILAPFNAVISDRYAQLGSYVSPGTALLYLEETDRFEINAEVPASLADTLATSSDIRYIDQEQSWPASLLRISPVIDTERRVRRARLEFSGSTAPVGSSGELVWVVANSLLPANLLVRRDGDLGIFVYEDGIATFMPIGNAQEGRPVQVTLPDDTKIIVRGRERLQPGDRVSISE